MKNQDLENSIAHSTKDIKRTMVKCFTISYLSWLLLASLFAMNLYLDYKCQYSGMMDSYIYERNQSSISTMNDKLKLLNMNKNIRGIVSQNNTQLDTFAYECESEYDCNHGDCELIRDIHDEIVGSKCVCDEDYLTIEDDICNYHQLSGLTALLLSIFLGGCGIDRCFMARGCATNSCQVCLGVLKAFTLGGLGIWWLIDIILISTGSINDGNGQPLTPI